MSRCVHCDRLAEQTRLVVVVVLVADVVVVVVVGW